MDYYINKYVEILENSDIKEETKEKDEEEEEEEEEEGKKVVIKWFDNNKNSNELNRPVINMKLARLITDKLKHLNILDFGSNLKIYDEKEKRYKKKVILDKFEK